MAGLDNIIGYDSVKDKLRRVSDIIKHYDKYEKLGVSYPRGFILDGEPGVGKTLMATSFMEECGINNVTVIRKEKGSEHLLGDIHEAFRNARNNQPSIILFDDLDKYENEDEKYKDGEAYIAIQAGIDSILPTDKVFVIGTVNGLRKLPDSLTRSGRFGESIRILPPKKEDAERIIKHYLSKFNVLGDIDYKELADILLGHTCADLEEVVNKAGALAVYDRKPLIDMDCIIEACLELEYQGVNAITDKVKLEEREGVAYHEAGHIVLSEIIAPNSVSLASIRKYESCIQGITIKKFDEDYRTDIEVNYNNIREILGGSAAFFLKYGKMDLGADTDYHRAFYELHYLIQHGGVTGVDKYEVYGDAQSQSRLMDKENTISSKLNYYYLETMGILYRNKEFLEKIASALLVKQTLREKDIQEIKSSCVLVK